MPGIINLKNVFLALLVSVFSSYSAQALSLTDLVGTWVSDHDYFVQLQITMIDGEPVARAYKHCDQGLCRWAEATLQGYSRIAQHSDEESSFSASFLSASAQFELKIRPRDGYLEAEIVSQAFDAEGPHQQIDQLTFHRQSSGSANARLAGPMARASISGKAIGPARQTASLFQVSLYGPNDREHFVQTQNLHEGYRFDRLEDGLYWIFIGPRGSTGVQVSPEQQLIRIRDGQPVVQDIALD